MATVFETLSSINVNEHTEKKGNLTYLSWAWAWAECKKNYPDATYTIYENEQGWNYHTDGKTAWVKTGVTIEGMEHIEYLPVMDFKNKSIPIGNVTSFDVNKTIQRSLTKALARHGLGLYIYAGEDLPEESAEEIAEKKTSLLKSINDVVKALADAEIPTNFVCKLYKIDDMKALDQKKCENILKHIDDIKKKMEEQK